MRGQLLSYLSAYGGVGGETLAVFYEILSNDGKRTVEASCISGTGVCLIHDLLDNISELVDAITRVDETETVYYASVRDRREYFSKLCREGYSEEESAYVVEKNTDKYAVFNQESFTEGGIKSGNRDAYRD